MRRQFYLLLKTFFPESNPYISKEKDHVITKYEGKYYDITGEVSGNWYTPMTKSEIDMASGCMKRCQRKTNRMKEFEYLV